MTHCRLASEKCRLRPMDGRATFTMAMSRTTMNWAAAMATRANHRRGSATARAVDVLKSDEFPVPEYSMPDASLVEHALGLLVTTGRDAAAFPVRQPD